MLLCSACFCVLTGLQLLELLTMFINCHARHCHFSIPLLSRANLLTQMAEGGRRQSRGWVSFDEQDAMPGTSHGQGGGHVAGPAQPWADFFSDGWAAPPVEPGAGNPFADAEVDLQVPSGNPFLGSTDDPPIALSGMGDAVGGPQQHLSVPASPLEGMPISSNEPIQTHGFDPFAPVSLEAQQQHHHHQQQQQVCSRQRLLFCADPCCKLS